MFFFLFLFEECPWILQQITSKILWVHESGNDNALLSLITYSFCPIYVYDYVFQVSVLLQGTWPSVEKHKLLNLHFEYGCKIPI